MSTVWHYVDIYIYIHICRHNDMSRYNYYADIYIYVEIICRDNIDITLCKYNYVLL